MSVAEITKELVAAVYLLCTSKDEWEEKSSHSGIKYHTRYNILASGIEIHKLQCTLQIPLDDLKNILYDPEKRNLWDPFCYQSSVIETEGQNSSIVYESRHPTFPGTPTEFVFFRTVVSINSQEVIIAQRSVEHPRVPESPELRRGGRRSVRMNS
jgi:hypothetical protein